VCGVNEGGTGIDGCCDGECFRDLFSRGAVTCRGFGMNRDTAVTPDSDRDCERDQFADLRTEQIGLLTGGAQRLIALDRVWADFGNFAYAYHELLAINITIENGRVTSPDFRPEGGNQD